MKKIYRVRKNEEFQKLIAGRRFVSSGTFVIYFKKKREDHARVGLSVSKKLGNAVKRNKVKRQVRMMLQECFEIHGEYDVIVIVRQHYLKQNYADNKKDLETILKKVKIKSNVK